MYFGIKNNVFLLKKMLFLYQGDFRKSKEKLKSNT